MEEIWKTVVIDGEEWDNYEVSNMGRIRSLNFKRTGKIKVLKLKNNGKGYLQVALSNNGIMKYYLIHRLVANTFIPNPNNYTEVNHIDENKSNNYVNNLEWVSHKENMNHGTRTERSTKTRSKKKMSEVKKTLYEQGFINPMYGKHHVEETKKKISESRKGNKNPRSRSIICIETKQVFTTIQEAREWLGKGDIVHHLRGKLKSAGKHPITGEKLHWMYYEDYLAQHSCQRVS